MRTFSANARLPMLEQVDYLLSFVESADFQLPLRKGGKSAMAEALTSSQSWSPTNDMTERKGACNREDGRQSEAADGGRKARQKEEMRRPGR